ncbi:unnamed protein product [Urochloa humidicola]
MSPPPRREAGDRDATITSDSRNHRLRIARVGSDGGDGEAVRPWASLAEDLLELIGCLVLAGDLLEYDLQLLLERLMMMPPSCGRCTGLQPAC